VETPVKVSDASREVIHRLFRVLQAREWNSRTHSALWRLPAFMTLQGITFEEATEEVLRAILTMCSVNTQDDRVPAELIDAYQNWRLVVSAALEAMDTQRSRKS
jgi:hypothetical protein